LNKQTVIIAAFLIVIISGLGRILGFIREVVVAYFFGADEMVDALNIAMIAPNIVLNLIAPAIGIALVPIIISYRKKYGNDEISALIIKLLFLAAIISSFMVVIVTPGLYKSLLNFSTDGILETSIQLGVFAALLIFLYFIHVVLTNYLQTVGLLTRGATTGLAQVAIIIISIIIMTPYIGIYSVVLGTVIGVLVQNVILLYSAKGILNVKLKLWGKYKNELKEFFINKEFYLIVLSVIIGMGSFEIILTMDRLYAVNYESGTVSALGYAVRLMNLPLMILPIVVGAVYFPTLSELAIEKKFKEIGTITVDIIRGIVVLVIPITVFAYFYSLEIVSFVFERGAFDREASILTANILSTYILLVPLVSIHLLLIRMLIALRSWTYTITIGVIGIACNILISYLFLNDSINEVGYATIISMLIILSLEMVGAKKILKYFNYIRLIRMLLIICIVSMLAYLITDLITTRFIIIDHQAYHLIHSAFWFLSLYFIALYALRIKEIYYIINKIKARLERRSI
jgi:putative peptidoglycan lipid II flippase